MKGGQWPRPPCTGQARRPAGSVQPAAAGRPMHSSLALPWRASCCLFMAPQGWPHRSSRAEAGTKSLLPCGWSHGAARSPHLLSCCLQASGGRGARSPSFLSPSLHAHTHAHACAYVHAHCIHKCTHMHICAHRHAHTRVRARMHIHTRTQACTHAHAHTCTYSLTHTDFSGGLYHSGALAQKASQVWRVSLKSGRFGSKCQLSDLANKTYSTHSLILDNKQC